jgi:hypothetical protein
MQVIETFQTLSSKDTLQAVRSILNDDRIELDTVNVPTGVTSTAQGNGKANAEEPEEAPPELDEHEKMARDLIMDLMGKCDRNTSARRASPKRSKRHQ